VVSLSNHTLQELFDTPVLRTRAALRQAQANGAN
jgi:hypothetical protein